ncbi:MAG TPA: DUF2868 domain-containing protein [Phycisphaerales bacterium]|nr:DUF2868 domain-containing protein [Phycisphaerales bacterium]
MPTAPDSQTREHPGGRIRFRDRLLAEASAAWEQLETAPVADHEANDLARQFEGDFEHRLVRRAAALPAASTLADALHHVRSAVGLMIIAALIAALLGGIATARAVLGVPRDEPVNIFHVLAATLLPQLALLALWLIVIFLPRSSGPLLSIASLGGLVVRGGQWLAQRIHPGRAYAAAVAGLSRAFLRGGLGRWTFSSISHALWLAFNVGCLGMLVFLLSTRQYTFAWETTILSAETYRPLTHAVAALPKTSGFISPSDEQIASSRWEGVPLQQSEGTSQAWSSLLVGSIVVYGLAPRLLLLGLSLGQRRTAKSRYRLDVDRPEFARLRGVLEPPAAMLGVVDADAGARAPVSPPRAARASGTMKRAAGGLPAIVGFELPRSTDGNAWPPAVHGVRWHDLGMVDTREERQRAVAELSRAAQEPASLVIVCSLTTTPDRGVSTFLADLAGTVAHPPAIVLTGGQRLRERQTADSPESDHSRTSSFDARLADWRIVAGAAGIPEARMIEVDLDHLTQTSQSRLAAIAGASESVAAHERRIEPAFDLIARFAADAAAGKHMSDASALSVLHTEIARLYSDSAPRWRTLLRVPENAAALMPQNLGERLTAGARRFVDFMPDRLKRSPKWLAAGASAGALGCIAAAAMISPIAISALPIWSGLGAAIAAVMQPTGTKAQAEVNGERSSGGIDAAMRSAALFAMLLEMQGYQERTITRVLDAVVTDNDNANIDASRARLWLNDLRHRFDLALAKEAR